MIANVVNPDDDTSQRKQRCDGVEARQHLLHTALKIFAQKGFADASIREIAAAAGVNISAISYYFGDKAGLYRAAFTEPMGCVLLDQAEIDAPELTLRESLTRFYHNYLAPLTQNEWVQYCVRLHFREMLEPTGLWAAEIDQNIKPSHAVMVGVVCRHLMLTPEQADDDVHRLVFSIAALAVHLFCGREVIDAISPHLINSPAEIDRWRDRLVDFAEAMILSEKARRAG